jgi:hypothetical protein
MGEGGGACVLITGPRQPSRRAACVKRGGGEGAGKVVEQQLGALGNPCSSFSSPSLLCIRRGFDKNFTPGNAIHLLTLFEVTSVLINQGFGSGFVFNRTIGSGSVILIRIRIQEGKNDPQK